MENKILNLPSTSADFMKMAQEYAVKGFYENALKYFYNAYDLTSKKSIKYEILLDVADIYSNCNLYTFSNEILFYILSKDKSFDAVYPKITANMVAIQCMDSARYFYNKCKNIDDPLLAKFLKDKLSEEKSPEDKIIDEIFKVKKSDELDKGHNSETDSDINDSILNIDDLNNFFDELGIKLSEIDKNDIIPIDDQDFFEENEDESDDVDEEDYDDDEDEDFEYDSNDELDFDDDSNQHKKGRIVENRYFATYEEFLDMRFKDMLLDKKMLKPSTLDSQTKKILGVTKQDEKREGTIDEYTKGHITLINKFEWFDQQVDDLYKLVDKDDAFALVKSTKILKDDRYGSLNNKRKHIVLDIACYAAFKLGLNEKASKLLNEDLSIKTDSINYVMYLLSLAVDLKDLKAQKTCVNIFLESKSFDTKVISRFFELLSSARNYDELLRFFKIRIKQYPDFYLFNEFYAIVLYNMGEVDKAKCVLLRMKNIYSMFCNASYLLDHIENGNGTPIPSTVCSCDFPALTNRYSKYLANIMKKDEIKAEKYIIKNKDKIVFYFKWLIQTYQKTSANEFMTYIFCVQDFEKDATKVLDDIRYELISSLCSYSITDNVVRSQLIFNCLSNPKYESVLMLDYTKHVIFEVKAAQQNKCHEYDFSLDQTYLLAVSILAINGQKMYDDNKDKLDEIVKKIIDNKKKYKDVSAATEMILYYATKKRLKDLSNIIRVSDKADEYIKKAQSYLD